MIQLLLAVIYLAFISLGLPDALLGSAWPVIYPELGVNVSYAGVLAAIVSLGTIISSLMSDRLTHRLGAGRVTALSVATTALALFGYSVSREFWMLCLWAIPYGLGAGSVDAALNNYVALHYESRHMSWLHCMWGVGASLGPYIMGFALSADLGWHSGYRMVALLQLVLTAVLVFSLPLWKKPQGEEGEAAETKVLTLPEILRIPGVKAVMLCFFCYCALEQTAALWAASYLNLHLGLDPDTAARYGAVFFIGITLGRAVCGFLTMRLDDTRMIRLGTLIIAAGVIALALPLGAGSSVAGLALIGLGCAPVYPCIIHSTPAHFGPGRSQAVIGVQMASAYVGTCLMPPLFGLIADRLSVALMPFYMGAILAVLVVMHEVLLKRTGGSHAG